MFYDDTEKQVEIRSGFPFQPLNGYLVITKEEESTGHAWCGTVLVVCESLKDEIKVGDRVLYEGVDRVGRYISFGKFQGYLVNVKELYGFWKTDRVRQIFNAQKEGHRIVKKVSFEGIT